MAEVAGLVLGVVSLAGVFKDCIDLFDYISATRSIGRDYELLNTKLEVEKTLLLQWASRVRLLAPNHDPRLDDPDIDRAIARVLASIQLLLGDSQTLQQQYGLRSVGQSFASSSVVVPTVRGSDLSERAFGLSGSRMTRFLSDFKELSLRLHGPSEDVPLLRRVRWAVHDRERFDGLIQQLSYFIRRLDNIVPDTQNQLVSMTMDDLERVDFAKLRLVIQASTGREALMASSAEHAIDLNCSARILQLFWYRVMDDRRFSVTAAHASTLQWALEPPSADSERWDDLSCWLGQGSDTYWISGKAGSGKSTLMKYLYGHQKTKTLLRRWAGSSPLVMANFFFYALGTPEQKSQEGLVRALLYQILDAEPLLIPTLFPDLWRQAQASEDAPLQLPTLQEMKAAISVIGTGSAISNQRFCFFIDGLDEYSGDHFDGVSFLKTLVANKCIKMLVSSRPIPACVQAFIGKPRLQLQDLNGHDIAVYIHNAIRSHGYMKQLTLLEPDQVDEILGELVNKAAGVFLWVVLACRSLIEGFAAYDNASELRRRVDELPPELENLFRHMMGKIEPRYRAQASRILRVCYQNQLNKCGLLNSICLAVVDDMGMDPTKFSLQGPMSAAQKQAKCEVLEGRLRSRCCGLLEVVKLAVPDRCFCATRDGEHNRMTDSVVTFIHRTLFDYLDQKDLWSLELLQINDSQFDPSAILSWVSLQALVLNTSPASAQVGHFIGNILIHATLASSNTSSLRLTGKVIVKLGEQLQSLLQENPSSLPFMDQLWDSWDLLGSKFPFALLLAVESGMVDFIRRHSQRYPLPKDQQPYKLLLHATTQPFMGWLPSCQLSVSTKMVKYLLSSGNDPNAEFGGARKESVWKRWLWDLRVRGPTNSIATVEVTRELVRAGADLDIARGELGEDLEVTIRRLFLADDPYDEDDDGRETMRKLRETAEDILRILEDRRAPLSTEDDPSVQSPQIATELLITQRAGDKRPSPRHDQGLSKRPKLGNMELD